MGRVGGMFRRDHRRVAERHDNGVRPTNSFQTLEGRSLPLGNPKGSVDEARHRGVGRVNQF